MILYTTNFLDDARELLDEAAREPLARIRADRERVPAKIKPLLEYLEGHLFDRELNVNRLKRACNVRDNSLTLVFHAQVGASPKSYITERRLETAAWLLRETDLRIWQISELVGYSGLSVFGKAFDRWADERPGAYRKRFRESREEENGSFDGRVDDDFLAQALAGELPEEQAGRMIRQLLEIYHPELLARPG